MPAYPMCSKCPVISALSDYLSEIAEFKESISANNLDLLSDHARGYCHGKLAVITELSNEWVRLLEYVEREREIHLLRVKIP